MVTSARSARGGALAIASAVALGLLLSACEFRQVPAAPPATSAAASPASPVSSAAGAPAASATAAAAPSATSPGALRVSADIDLGTMSGTAQAVAAEAPDGAVFYADGQVVMVVDGDSAPQVAEHAGATVLALGASTTTLYVITPQDLTAYSRSSGNQTGQWALTGSPATPTTAGVVVGGNGDVWAWTDWATDESGYEYGMLYAVLPGASAPGIVSKDVEPGTLTTDGTHAFFLVPNSSSTGSSLIEATPAAGGSAVVTQATVAPAPAMPLVGFSDSQVVLFAQPDSLYTFTPGSAGTAMVHTTAGLPVWVAGTDSGLLFLTCAKQVCDTVTEVDQSTGTSGQSLAVPANSDILLGPDPAVVGLESGHLHLVRLS